MAGLPQRRLNQFFRSLGQIVLLCREVFLELVRPILPLYISIQLTLEQILFLGIRSLPLILISGIATGSVFALQLGYGLERFGGNIYIPEVVGLALLRELGPVLTGLLLAGRLGSGVTAELSSMAVSEQIEAIRALGTSPIGTLIIPRILACAIVFPILTLLADYIAVLSAMFVSQSQFALEPRFYLSKLFQIVIFVDLGTGLIKALVFGLAIGIISCWRGLFATGGTHGVGIATSSVVVTTSITVLVSDVFLSKLFISLGIYGVSP